jgi:hypothetical protein
MSENTTSPPPAKAPPLFTLDLGENGGQLAPTSYEELTRWIQTEQSFWSWTQTHQYGGHDNPQREAMSRLAEALNAAHGSQQHIQSNTQHSKQQLEFSRDRLLQAFLNLKLPHSSTPLAKRVEAYRKDVSDKAASYFLAVHMVAGNGQQQHQFQAQDFAAWRGMFDALMERFQLVQLAAKGRKAAAEQSLDQLRAKAETLLGEKTAVFDELHREYQQLADGIRTRAAEQKDAFQTSQGSRSTEFEALTKAHQEAMEGLRKTFREELALRAPAEYWSKKRKGHFTWAWVTGVASFVGIGGAALGLGWQIHALLNKTPVNTVPEAWRLAVLALVGVFTVWALRLVVRMFLSHLHLLTDAGERVVMVQTYLSLLEGDHLTSKEDRQLILQALFRPASDGIVKDEGVPFSLAEALTRSGKP